MKLSENKGVSIYKMITKELKFKKLLPEDFFIYRKRNLFENDIHFFPGAKDGIKIYNTCQNNLEDKKLFNLLETVILDNTEENRKKLDRELNKKGTLINLDYLITRTYENKKKLNNRRIRKVSSYLLFESDNIETVKLAIILMSHFDDIAGIHYRKSGNEIFNAIYKLGKYEELTLYALIALTGLPY